RLPACDQRPRGDHHRRRVQRRRVVRRPGCRLRLVRRGRMPGRASATSDGFRPVSGAETRSSEWIRSFNGRSAVMQKKLMGAVAVAAVAALATSGAAMAAPPIAKAKQTTVGYNGVQVAIDPATGRMRAPT